MYALLCGANPRTILSSEIVPEQIQLQVTNNLDAEMEKKLKLPPKQIVKGRPRGKKKLVDKRKKNIENGSDEDVDDDLNRKPVTMGVW